jgi:branched-chain amino acid aminotransferase
MGRPLSAIAYVDGRWLDARTATIPIDDRGFLMGDGVYDTCRVFDGAYFRFDQHAERLRESAAVLRIDAPPVVELRAIAEEILARNRDPGAGAVAGLDHAVLRVTLTRGSGGAGLGTAGAGPVRVVATVRALPRDWRQRARAGWSVVTAATRHPPGNVLPPMLKGQGRIASLLARLEAEAAGCNDALLLSTDGRITEGTTWNIFWRVGDVVRTPAPTDGLLAGVTRAVVLELAAGAGYTVEEGSWPRAELDAAHEAFATLTSLGLVPIHSLDGRRLPGTGEAADRLTSLYWERVRQETRD